MEYNDNILHIHASELLIKMKVKELIIIDIREPFELEESSVPSAINIPMNALLNNIDSLLQKEKHYYILCHTGQRSYYVTSVLSDIGYHVTNVVGGIALMPEFYHC